MTDEDLEDLALYFTKNKKKAESPLLDEYQEKFIMIRPLPFVTESLGDEILEKIKNNDDIYVYCKTVGEPISGTGDHSDETYGEILINDKIVYFIIIDDPGMSGYDCCGGIYLDYCNTMTEFISFGLTEAQKKSILELQKEADNDL